MTITVEGKRYFTLAEAAETTGYAVGTIRWHISKRNAEGKELGSGEWVLTAKGMEQIKVLKAKGEARKGGSESKLEMAEDSAEIIAVTKKIEPEQPKEEKSDHIVDGNKMAKGHGPNGKSIHFTSEKGLRIYDKLVTLASAKEMTVKDLAICMLETSVKGKEELFEKIEQLEQQKRALLEQL
jgi:hypothetical protein